MGWVVYQKYTLVLAKSQVACGLGNRLQLGMCLHQGLKNIVFMHLVSLQEKYFLRTLILTN